MTPQALLDAINTIRITDDHQHNERASEWLVIDTSKGHQLDGLPGIVMSRHTNNDEARLAWAAAIIKTATS